MSKTILVIFMLAIAPSVIAQSAFQTIGPVGCGSGKNNCHSNEDPKMIDKHKNAIDDMMGSDNLAAYTEKAGVDLKGVLVGKNICMSCHGTALSGKETKEVEQGVSCESCHGAGSGYKGPHLERLPTEKKGDPNRSGYTQSLALGLINLKNIAIRAEACVRCHYITDQRVLASGHPDGSKFNYLAGMKSVAKHWTTHAITDADLNKDSFSAAKKSKGTTGQVMAVKNIPVPQPPPPASHSHCLHTTQGGSHAHGTANASTASYAASHGTRSASAASANTCASDPVAGKGHSTAPACYLESKPEGVSASRTHGDGDLPSASSHARSIGPD